MSLYVNTNVGTLRGNNALNNINSQLDQTYQRLSSGLRISSAKDDAAGLAISDRMTSQINGLNQANRNLSDGIALMQTMEGAIDEISNNLQQIRTLAVQYGNGTNTAEDKTAIKNQSDALCMEITRISCTTLFGGKKILSVPVAGTSLGVVGDGYTNGTAVPTKQNKFTFQIGANGGDTLDLQLSSFSLSVLVGASGPSDESYGAANNILSKTGSDAVINLASTKPSASDGRTNMAGVLGVIDDVIGYVDAQRGTLGAAMNRMESTIRNQSNVIANQSDARSRIRDTDFAEESAKLSQQSIIQQAAMSMLMQANARPQMALNLLG